jgi:hypothetical protein
MTKFLDYFVPFTLALVSFLPMILMLWDAFTWLIGLPMLQSWVVWETARILAAVAYTFINLAIWTGLNQ